MLRRDDTDLRREATGRSRRRSLRHFLAVSVLIALGSCRLEAAGIGSHQRQLLFDILHAETGASDGPRASEVSIERDTVPPQVTRVQVVTHPDDPARRQVHEAGNVFVGMGVVELRVFVSEPMESPPKVELAQPNGLVQPAAMTDGSRNPLFIYRVFPSPAPDANGPAALRITGEFDGAPPDFGFDRARNPLVAFEQPRAILVDTLPPGLARVDTSQPGRFRSIPPENRALPAHGFPREISVFVDDYNRPDDGSFSGANVARDLASGVDFSRVGNGVTMRVRDPRGRELPGTVVARPPSLVLILPDPYDPATGVFPDANGDGRADPIQGTYRIEADLLDRAGNATAQNLSLGLDATPLEGRSVAVSIRPIFAEPFPNPRDPIPEAGTAVRRLESLEVRGTDPDFDLARSNAKLFSRLGGPGTVPREVRTTQRREADRLVLLVERDQDGDGRDDFENPEPGAFLPPGVPDPRLGRNDGTYIVEVTAFDRAGNSSIVRRELVLDTTKPRSEADFPGAGVQVRGPLRVVDAFLDDPVATSGHAGSGISIDHSSIALAFRGNGQRPAGPVRGNVFLHTPNPDDPTRPDFDPNDRRFKVLFAVTDGQGRTTTLPTDGSADGVYEMTVLVRDRAGNDDTFTASFEYTQSATAPLMAPLHFRSTP